MTDYKFIDITNGRIAVVPHDDRYTLDVQISSSPRKAISMHLSTRGRVYAYQFIEAHSAAVAESCIAAFLHRCDIEASRSLDYGECLENDELAGIYAENECTKLDGAINKLSHLLTSTPVTLSAPTVHWPLTQHTRPSEDDYRPRFSLLDIIPSHRADRIADAVVRYSTALSEWQAVTSHNDGIDKFLDGYHHALPADVENFAALVIAMMCDDDWAGQWMGNAYDISYTNGILCIEYGLPALDGIPDKSCKYDPKSGGHDYIPLRPSEAAQLYDTLAYSLILLAAYNVFTADQASVIRHVSIKGIVTHDDPATGNFVSPCILSLDVDRDAMLSIYIASVQPEACFKHLGGISAGRPSQYKPIPTPQKNPATAGSYSQNEP